MTFRSPSQRRRIGGFSLVEMMVAVAIGLLLISALSVVYVNSRTGNRRVDQMSSMQQGVRTAFEYLGFDSRMAGHLGCFTGSLTNTIGSGTGLADNFRTGVEGYEFTGTANGSTITVTNALPTDTNTAASWSNNAGTGSTAGGAIPISAISSAGLTPNSDVLILRGPPTATPIRISAVLPSGALAALPIDNNAQSTGSCANGSANVSGFCGGSYGFVASCTSAQMFTVVTAAASALTVSSSVASPGYAAAATEVFPLQTSIYYVRRSSSNTTTSLYRRVMDGNRNEEQELIEGVENMQVRYAVDTVDDPGIIDGNYVTANGVGDWARVIAVRVSLMMRSGTQVDSTTVLPVAQMNGVTFNLPTSSPAFDRRTFTTTIALRNRLALATR